MPWLVSEVSLEIESIITSRDVLTGECISRVVRCVRCECVRVCDAPCVVLQRSCATW